MSNSVLELERVNVSIKDSQILNGVTFDLIESEFVYLIGPSGAGKSSLMKLLFGLLPHTEGKATVAGYDLKQLSISNMHLYRRKVGMIFQDFRLFSDWTVGENLDFVLRATDWRDKAERETKIAEALQSVNLESKYTELVHTLSGGEQQKLAIIRALLNSPEILLADEPTGNLDPENAEQIIHLLHSVATETDTAILLTTHHHDLVDKFPARTLVCKNKTVEEV